MIAIAKESLALLHFESLRQKHRTNGDGLELTTNLGKQHRFW